MYIKVIDSMYCEIRNLWNPKIFFLVVMKLLLNSHYLSLIEEKYNLLIFYTIANLGSQYKNEKDSLEFFLYNFPFHSVFDY